VPQASTTEQAETIVQAGQVPLLGKRGVAWSARSHLFRAGDGARYLQRHNEESIVAIHIETAEAVENLEQILSVPGIDIAYVGPVDLSVSMGYAAVSPGHPEVEAAADRILEVARKYGVKAGYQVGNARDAEARFEWGATYVGVAITPVLYSAFKHIVSDRA
jgi:4-hydroxy-2-oxoheptanedioate aldolase